MKELDEKVFKDGYFLVLALQLNFVNKIEKLTMRLYSKFYFLLYRTNITFKYYIVRVSKLLTFNKGKISPPLHYTICNFYKTDL